jgi:hypothetical protein
MSLHATITKNEVKFVCDSIIALSQNFQDWQKDYNYNDKSNEFKHKNELDFEDELIKNWFY